MKKNFIEVYDNFLPSFIEDKIHNISINNLPYIYKPNVFSASSNEFFPGFSHELYNSRGNFMDFQNFPIFSQILHYFCSSQQINLTYIERYRTFFYLPCPGKDLSLGIHKDLEDQPHWTCIYYVNNSDGDTVFFDEDENEIKRVSPKKGRIVFFDGNVKHSGNYPTQNERIGVNINFIGEL